MSCKPQWRPLLAMGIATWDKQKAQNSSVTNTGQDMMMAKKRGGSGGGGRVAQVDVGAWLTRSGGRVSNSSEEPQPALTRTGG